jgi:hypothetical protein
VIVRIKISVNGCTIQILSKLHQLTVVALQLNQC